MKSLTQLLHESYAHINMRPPEGVKSACKRGLALKGKHGGDGLTGAAVAWAKKLSTGQPITPEKVRKMHAFFARHKVDKRAGWDKPPTPGYVAWQLWGGDAGRAWSDKLCKQLDKSDSNANEAAKPNWKKKGLVGPGGAMKTAKRQAKKQGKKNNKAYVSAIYAKMTGKK